ncbi:MAG: exonuclease SbcCD subunit D [Clostridia bacterium]|nr:exonuclease SbcCD subunit D [Clostridia bacterium]
MKFFHLADLHFGKQLHGLSLIAEGDQGAWVERFFALVEEHRPDAVVVSGDVYDRSMPSREAVELFDRFLTGIAQRGVPVLLVAGNHDSGPRLNFASALLEQQNVYISGTIGRELRTVLLHDEHGPVRFWLMPYLFPAAVEEVLGVEELRTYDAAARALIGCQEIDPKERNVLIAHQLVLADKRAPEEGGSETMLGGVGQIDCSAFDVFDYVALGHIHKPQAIGRASVRYAGSPMCYHFDEIGWKKGALLVEMDKNGYAGCEMLEIEPLHPLRVVRGTLRQIIESERQGEATGEYIRAVLTDENLPAGAAETLDALFRSRSSKLLEVVREIPKAENGALHSAKNGRERDIAELFSEFYRTRMGGELPSAQEEALIAFAANQTENAPADASEQELDALAEKLAAFALGQEAER